MADRRQKNPEQFFRKVSVSDIILSNLAFVYEEENSHFSMFKRMTAKSCSTVGQELQLRENNFIINRHRRHHQTALFSFSTLGRCIQH